MRIIAGKFRTYPLVSPPGGEAVTRPITDRAKQSLFDALQDCFAVTDDLGHAGTVLDCFAGTGSMGLECLSRGAAKCIFVERDRGALKGLKENFVAMDLRDGDGHVVVLPVDAYLLAQQPHLLTDHGLLTVAFVDPPYSHTDTGHFRHQVDDLLRTLAAHCLVDGGIISFRHPTHVSIDPATLGVRIVREFKYGDMGITWLVKA
jgi:16S rRNA (guanine966-N2)-methyltransferase